MGSPDGRRVAAVALATKSDGSTPKGVSGPVIIFDARDGRRLRDLTHGHDLEPAFSPDGRTVAFVRGHDLFTVPARGGRAQRLARGVASPSWAKR